MPVAFFSLHPAQTAAAAPPSDVPTIEAQLLNAAEISSIAQAANSNLHGLLWTWLESNRRRKIDNIELGEIRRLERKSLSFDLPSDRHSIRFNQSFHAVDLFHVPWPFDDVNCDIHLAATIYWKVDRGAVAVRTSEVQGSCDTSHALVRLGGRTRFEFRREFARTWLLPVEERIHEAIAHRLEIEEPLDTRILRVVDLAADGTNGLTIVLAPDTSVVREFVIPEIDAIKRQYAGGIPKTRGKKIIIGLCPQWVHRQGLAIQKRSLGSGTSIASILRRSEYRPNFDDRSYIWPLCRLLVGTRTHSGDPYWDEADDYAYKFMWKRNNDGQ